MSRNGLVSYVAFWAGSVVCPQINTVAGLNTHGMKDSCELEFILIKGQPLKINIVPFQIFSYLIFSMVCYSHYSFRWREKCRLVMISRVQTQNFFHLCSQHNLCDITKLYFITFVSKTNIFFYSKKLLVFFCILGCITLINTDVVIIINMIFWWTCSFYDSYVR